MGTCWLLDIASWPQAWALLKLLTAVPGGLQCRRGESASLVLCLSERLFPKVRFSVFLRLKKI